MQKLTKIDAINMFERMAELGTAPFKGCNILGTGYEEVFDRLRKKFLSERFDRKVSSQKFIVGPFGSGKTHFLRQLMEIAGDMSCATSEVALNKDVDFTQRLMVYSEVIRNLTLPNNFGRGAEALIRGAIENVKSSGQNSGAGDILVNRWIQGIDNAGMEFNLFSKVVKKALNACIEEDSTVLDLCCRWLEGEFNNTQLAKDLGIPSIEKNYNNLKASQALLSLFQFVNIAGFRGTVVCFDEAEQGLTMDRKKTDKMLSMFMSAIEAVSNLQEASALIIYALTYDIIEKMKRFPALQQRITEVPGQGFFDGNTLAPIITLSQEKPEADLTRMGMHYTDLFYSIFEDDLKIEKDKVINEVKSLAQIVVEQETSSSNRRYMVKNVCGMLLRLLENGELKSTVTFDDNPHTEAEV